MDKKKRLRHYLSKMKNKRGFTLIEFLCTLAIIAIIAVMAVPQFTAMDQRAKDSVTVASMRATVGTIQGSMMLYEHDEWYAPRASWDSAEYSDISMNNYLEKLFENGSVPNESYSYENQVSGSRVILNWSNPLDGSAENPAMFLTNSSEYSFENSSPGNMSLLRGTIIVYFATENVDGALSTSYIEVYYTDENGVKCDDSLILTM